jgi:hypothetical protein
MLELQIAENALEFEDQTALNLTLANPAFDPGSLARAYSYPFRIPHSPTNVAALQHRHRLDARDGTGYSPAALRLAGNPFQEGRAYVEKHSERSSELVFQNDDLAKIAALDDIAIRELVPPIEIPKIQQGLMVVKALDHPFLITINDNQYSQPSISIPLGESMAIVTAAINADFPGLATYLAGVELLVLEWTDEEEGISIAPSVLSYEVIEERQLSEARTYNLHEYIDSDPAPFAFPTVYAPNLYAQLNPLFTGYVNWWLNDKYIENSYYQDDAGWEVTYIPYVRIRWLLDKIVEASGLVEISFDLPTLVEELEELLIDNTTPLDRPTREFIMTDFLGWQNRNGFATEIDLANHLPDWSAKELLTRLAHALNCHIRFEDDRLIFVPNQSQANAPERDWTDYTAPAYTFEPQPRQGVTFSYAPAEEALPPNWAEAADFVLGAGENPFEVPFRPLWNITIPNLPSPVLSTWRLAYTEEVGTSETFSTRPPASPFRLFVYRGEQYDQQGNTYRLGASDTKDASDDEIGELSLIWAAGYFALFWRAWAEFMFTPIITRTIWLPLPELLRLRDFREPLVRIYHDNGEATALVRNVQVRIGVKGLGAAKVEFQRRL